MGTGLGQITILIWAGAWSLLAFPSSVGFGVSIIIKYLVYEHGVFARIGLLVFVGTKTTQIITAL